MNVILLALIIASSVALVTLFMGYIVTQGIQNLISMNQDAREEEEDDD